MTHFTIHGTADVHSLQEFNFHLFGGGAFKRSTIAFGAGIVFVCLLSYLLEMNLLFLLAIFIIFSQFTYIVCFLIDCMVSLK